MFAHSLRAMDAILQKAEAFCDARRVQPAALLDDRLAADMLPFRVQIMIATDHAKGAAGRLAGQDLPKFEDNQTTFAELRARIMRTLEYIESVPESAFADADGRTINVKAGPRELTFPAPQYLFSYAIPNFYFHLTTAYAILRHRGVEIGKRDFLGG
jgi:hypothetical protein